MPYTTGDGTYHNSRRCRQLHRSRSRVQRIAESGDRDPCDRCTDPDTLAEQARDVREADSDDLTALDDADVDVESIADDIIADRIDNGVCPWCDDYEGEHVGQHASSAHPDAWADYKDD